ncbi:MAG: flagellar biosynthetic protein FliO [Myxococcota bacterium]|jgi:flagellar biogenesis protein FliO|nr:flagellar biosynthetic protein FliO [Myxococcota bacterium]
MLDVNLVFASPASPSRLLELGLSLGCVTVALLFIIRLLRQRGLPSGARRIKILERLVLEPRRALHLVEVDGQTMLVGTSEQGVELLRCEEPRAPGGAPAAESAP